MNTPFSRLQKSKYFFLFQLKLCFFVFSLFLISFPLLSDDVLHKAAHNGDLAAVKKIFETHKINPDERDSYGGTVLHAAMFQDNVAVVEFLLEKKFDVNAQGTSNGYTPLHDAVWANNIEYVKILLKNRARTDIKGKDGMTPYEKAIRENKKNLAEMIKNYKK